MEALLRSTSPTLSDRVRETSKKRVSGADVAYHDDDLRSPVTKAAREEEKLTELELDALKSQSNNVASDNRALKAERVAAVNLVCGDIELTAATRSALRALLSDATLLL